MTVLNNGEGVASDMTVRLNNFGAISLRQSQNSQFLFFWSKKFFSGSLDLDVNVKMLIQNGWAVEEGWGYPWVFVAC